MTALFPGLEDYVGKFEDELSIQPSASAEWDSSNMRSWLDLGERQSHQG